MNEFTNLTVNPAKDENPVLDAVPDASPITLTGNLAPTPRPEMGAVIPDKDFSALTVGAGPAFGGPVGNTLGTSTPVEDIPAPTQTEKNWMNPLGSLSVGALNFIKDFTLGGDIRREYVSDTKGVRRRTAREMEDILKRMNDGWVPVTKDDSRFPPGWDSPEGKTPEQLAIEEKLKRIGEFDRMYSKPPEKYFYVKDATPEGLTYTDDPFSQEDLQDMYSRHQSSVEKAYARQKWLREFLPKIDNSLLSMLGFQDSSPIDLITPEKLAQWEQDAKDVNATPKPKGDTLEGKAAQANWFAARGFNGIFQNAPMMADAMLESAIGGLVGAEVAGPVGAKIGRYTAGTESMARLESSNFYEQGSQMLHAAAENYDWDHEDMYKADHVLAGYATLYGTISGIIENASDVFQGGQILNAWKKGTSKTVLDEAINQARKNPALWSKILSQMPPSLKAMLSEGLEEGSQNEFSNYFYRAMQRDLKAQGISVDITQDSTLDAAIIGGLSGYGTHTITTHFSPENAGQGDIQHNVNLNQVAQQLTTADADKAKAAIASLMVQLDQAVAPTQMADWQEKRPLIEALVGRMMVQASRRGQVDFQDLLSQIQIGVSGQSAASGSVVLNQDGIPTPINKTLEYRGTAQSPNTSTTIEQLAGSRRMFAVDLADMVINDPNVLPHQRVMAEALKSLLQSQATSGKLPALVKFIIAPAGARSWGSANVIGIHGTGRINIDDILEEVLHSATSSHIAQFIDTNKRGEAFINRCKDVVATASVPQPVRDLFQSFLDSIDALGLTQYVKGRTATQRVSHKAYSAVALDASGEMRTSISDAEKHLLEINADPNLGVWDKASGRWNVSDRDFSTICREILGTSAEAGESKYAFRLPDGRRFELSQQGKTFTIEEVETIKLHGAFGARDPIGATHMIPYHMGNLDEFLAGLYSDQGLRGALARLPARRAIEGNPNPTMWHQVLDALAKFFAYLGHPQITGTMLEQNMNAVNAFLEYTRSNPIYRGPLTPRKIVEGGVASRPLEQNDKGTTKGSTEFVNDTCKIIRLFTTADISTILHEFAHTFTPYLSETDLRTIAKWTKCNPEHLITWARSPKTNTLTPSERSEVHTALENFARGFEKYIRQGQAPVQVLQDTFSKLRSWMREIYQSIKDLTGTFSDQAFSKIPMEVKKIFEDMLVDEMERRGEYGEIANMETGERWQVYSVVRGKYHVFIPTPTGWRKIIVNNLMRQEPATQEQSRVFGVNSQQTAGMPIGAKPGTIRHLTPAMILGIDRPENARTIYEKLVSNFDHMTLKELQDYATARQMQVPPDIFNSRVKLADLIRRLAIADFELSMTDKPFFGTQRDSAIMAAVELYQKGRGREAFDVLVKETPVARTGRAILSAVGGIGAQYRKDLAELVESYCKPMKDMLHKAQQISADMLKEIEGAVSSDKIMLGKLMNPLLDYKGKVCSPAQAARNAREIRDLETIYWQGSHGYSKWQAATEGIFLSDHPAHYNNLTTRQRLIVNQMQVLSTAMGQLFEKGSIWGKQIGEGGTFIWDPKKEFTLSDGTVVQGAYRPFRQKQGFIVQRIFTEAMFDILATDNAHLRGRLVDALVAANSQGPNDPRSAKLRKKLQAKIMRMVRLYSAEQSGTTKMNSMEQLRTLAKMPSHIRLPISFTHNTITSTVEIMETNPLRWAEKMVHNAASRYSFIAAKAEFDPSTGCYNNQVIHRKERPAKFRNKLSMERTQYANIVQSRSRLAAYDALIRGQNGLPVDDTREFHGAGKSVSTGYGTLLWQTNQVYRPFLNFMKSGLLSGFTTFLQNITETGQASGNFGIRNTLNAVVHTYSPSRIWGQDFCDTLDMLRDLGSRSINYTQLLPSKGHAVRDSVNIVASAMRAPVSITANRSEQMVVLAAKFMVDDLRGVKVGGRLVRNPKNYYRNTLRGMGYTESQVHELMSGTATPKLYDSILRRCVDYTVGTHSAPGELPWNAHNRTFNTWVNFYRYFQNQYVRTVGDVGRIVHFTKIGDYKSARGSAESLARKLLMTTVSGVSYTVLATMVMGLLKGDDDDLEQIWKKTSHPIDEPELALRFGWECFWQNAVFGPFRNAYEKVVSNPGAPLEETAASSITQFSVPATISIEFLGALAGVGPKYHGREPMDRWNDFLLRHFVGARHAITLGSTYIIGTDNKLDSALKAYFKAAREIKMPIAYTTIQNQEEDAVKFRATMKKASKMIAEGEDPVKIAQEIKMAIDMQTGTSVRRSLNARQVLKWYNPNDPEDVKRLAELRKRLTDEQMQKIIQYDTLLTQWAAQYN